MQDGLVKLLRSQPAPLFALLDAARDERIVQLLSGSPEEVRSLYEGNAASELANVAPYLLNLPDGSPWLETLVAAGWGKSWGIYLTSAQPFPEVRKHLRRFLLVELEEGKQVYFRFYDPRVLRIFLETAIPAEINGFFGPVASYLSESEDGQTLIKYAAGPRGLEVTSFPRV